MLFSFPVKDRSQLYLPLGFQPEQPPFLESNRPAARQGPPLAPPPPGTAQSQEQSCGGREAEVVPPGIPSPLSLSPNTVYSTKRLTAPGRLAPHGNPKGSGGLSTHSSASKTRPRRATVSVQLIYMGLYKATEVGICSLLIPNISSNKSQRPGCPGLPRH